MRIVSYNIFEGGSGRADPLAEVLLAQHADIVCLVEADDEEVLHRLAERLSMDMIWGQGKKHAVAMLSRWPIVYSINHAAISASVPCLLEMMVRDPAGVEWIVACLHLHPRATENDEEIREGEADAVLDLLERHRIARRPHLLLGDFNSNSPAQEIDPERCKPSTREQWRQNGGYLPRRVMPKFFNAGYSDAFEVVHPEMAKTAGTFTTRHPGQRVDYCLCYGFAPTQLKAAWIETDRLATCSSDHYPIGVEVTA